MSELPTRLQRHSGAILRWARGVNKLYRMGRYQDSLEWFRKTIALEPERAVVYVNLGDALSELGRGEEARRYYRRYLELWPVTPRREEIESRLATGR